MAQLSPRNTKQEEFSKKKSYAIYVFSLQYIPIISHTLNFGKRISLVYNEIFFTSNMKMSINTLYRSTKKKLGLNTTL